MRLIRRSLILLAFVSGLGTGLIPVSADAEYRPSVLDQAKSLEDLMRLVRRFYYEETDPVNLYDGAIAGYLAKLDPHSTYISPEELKETQDRLQGSFEGIGIYFEVIQNYLTVLSPIEGSPAFGVGLQPGDRIIKIDGQSAVGIKTDEVTRRLKGPKGTTVHVTVQREGYDDYLEFDIVRDKIDVPSVPYAFIVAPGVGYVKLTRFSSHTSEELQEALADLSQAGARKLVLDLRGNGGGYLEQAVAVSNLFLEKGRLVVYTEGRRAESEERHTATLDPVVSADVPLLVMVDSYSASASEIVSGAIQDYDRGLIVGHTTFGKGLVQKQFGLHNGGAVLLTVAQYMTPSGRPIQRPFSQDRLAYLEAGYDDYDPNTDPDSTAVKPVYFTEILEREVYGNGGVTPDVKLERDTLTVFERKLLRSHFFEFASRYASEFSKDYEEFDAYFERYELGKRELATFRSFLKERQVEVSDPEFRASADFIKRQIRRQFAQIRWGNRARGQVDVSQDSEVRQALALFAQAEALLTRRAQHYNRRKSGEGGRTEVAPPASSGYPVR